MSTEQNPLDSYTPLPAWYQLAQQQQLQQQPEPVDLTTFHEPDPLPEEEDEDDAPPSHPRERSNAVIEGDEVETGPEEEVEDDLVEDRISFSIRNDLGDEQTEEVLIRGRKDAVERVKQERMLHADATRKTQELARQRDGIADHVRQAQDQARTAYVQQLEAVKGTVLATAEPELRNVDWQKLYAEDPQEYLRLDAKQKHLQSVMLSIEQQQRSAAETQAREDHARLQERIQHSRAEVMAMDPTWSDQKYSQILSTVAQKYGFQLDEVAQVIDPRIIRLMSDVTKYHQGTDTRAIARKKVASTPKAIPAGPAAQPRATSDSRLERRFQRTGSLEDGAKLLERQLTRRR